MKLVLFRGHLFLLQEMASQHSGDVILEFSNVKCRGFPIRNLLQSKASSRCTRDSFSERRCVHIGFVLSLNLSAGPLLPFKNWWRSGVSEVESERYASYFKSAERCRSIIICILQE